jgi:hypothetical protein
MTVILRTTVLNATEKYMIGEDTIALADSIIDTRGDLYRFGVSEYGRCVGKVYSDTATGIVEHGYVFQGRVRYEDADETYLREVWLSIEDLSPPTPRVSRPVALDNIEQEDA